ncbi:hypothetical protein [Paraburkholderia sp. ZP32-5]|uniref:hypothetical protein n=1 Tax=Paraburkholderia sp. ZP32-5 TaxID=2883245 RepID=UPI001F41642E|nr:hypothetical protein [Paraburkholderia sp. ZP32-5]
MSKFVFTHGAYYLSCEPVQMPDGQFGAMVVITRASNGVLVTSRRFPDPERFERSDHAVGHARQWAIEWIDRFGA